MIIAAALLLSAAALSACTKDYGDDDVRKYIREDMGISSFSLTAGPEEYKGEDGYTDRIWTVSTDAFGLGEELVFHVCDDRYWGLEWVENRLTNDLACEKQRVLMRDFALPEGFTLEENTDASGWPAWIRIVCALDGRADFEKGALLVREYRAHAERYPTIRDTEFTLSFRVKESGLPEDEKLAGRDYSFSFDASVTDEKVREKLRKDSDEYLRDCIECGNLDRMDEYSTAERSEVIKSDPYNTEIRRRGEETAAYPGYAYDYYYGIPYGALYRILTEEGYEVEGDWRRFSFAGNDGNTYECAYGDGSVSMEVDKVNAVTDLNLDDGTEMQTVRLDEKLLGLLGKDAETFAAELRALDGEYYREIEVSGDDVRLRGKAREFGRLMRIYETRLEELRKKMQYYGSGYGFVYDNLTMVYRGITIRMGSDVPREEAESIVREAVGLAALCQVLNNGKEYEWSLEVSFAKRKDDGNWEKKLTYVLPGETIDYGKAYKAVK